MYTPGPSSLTLKGRVFLSTVVATTWLVLFSVFANQLIGAWPIRMNQVDWRFAAAGSFLSSMPQVAFELALLIALATLASARRAIRSAALLALILAVLGALVELPFLLDFVQARRQVPVDSQVRFTLGALSTAGFGGLFTLVFFWMGWKGWQASEKQPETDVRTKGAGLVIGQ